MALINPLHWFIVPFLCVFTIPLAIFAGITTTLAFSVLMFHVAIVYIDIAMTIIPRYIMGRGRYRALPPTYNYAHSRPSSLTPASPGGSVAVGGARNFASMPVPVTPGMAYTASGRPSPKSRERNSFVSLSGPSGAAGGPGGPGLGRRSRRPSQSSIASIGTITPINEVDDNTSGPGGPWILTSSGMDRDFEGVGGWRLDNRDDDADWANINSRLELPLERSQRHHHRSSSGDPTAFGEGSWLMMRSSRKDRSPESPARERSGGSRRLNTSPGSSRIRSNQSVPLSFPSREREEGYFGYFPQIPSPRSTKKTPG